jgi:hypothetical protein
MSYCKYFRLSIVVLTVVVIGLVLVPGSATAQSKITCDGGAECVLCSDECQDGLICWALVCSNGSASGCTPCVETKKQPSDFQKEKHGEQGDKALLAQLLSKDPEVAQALRSLK